jgi:hypothetical protein
MWHHRADMKNFLRRLFALMFKPVAISMDSRLEGLEHRLMQRMDRLENHVGTDAEVSAELAITLSRTLARIEERLDALEARESEAQAAAASPATR